jgi:lipoprotein-releasing system permease protein
MYRYVIALRYLRSRKITYLSIIGVAVGVAALIIVLAVMEGFQNDFHDRIRGVLSDVIVRYRGDIPPKEVEAAIRTVPHVTACTPRLKGMGLVIGPGGRGAVQIIGIEVEKEIRVSKLGEYIINSRLTSLAKKAAQDVDLLIQSLEMDIEGFLKQGDMPTSVEQDFLRLRRDLYPLISRLAKEPSAKRMIGLLDLIEERIVAFLDSVPRCPGVSPFVAKAFTGAPEAAKTYMEKRRQEIIKARVRIRDDLKSFNTGGAFAVPFADPREGREVIIGEELMQQLHVKVGDKVRIYTTGSKGLPSLDEEAELPRDEFTVAGTFRSRMYRFDSQLVYMPLLTAQVFQAREGLVSEIGVKLDDFANASAVKAEIARRLPGVDVKTWAEKRKTLLAAINLEKAFLFVLLFMIIVVAGFNMLATFLMMVTEKTRDLGILKSLGGSTWGIASIFFLCGVLIAIAGSGLGMGAGLLFVEYINEIEVFVESTTGMTPFPRDVYYLDSIPTIIDGEDLFWVLFPTVAVSVLLGSVFPALKAALLRPDQALRYE